MRVAAWYSGTPDQSSPKSENKCRLARPITLPNFVALRQKCARYPLWEIFSPGKLNQRSPKSLKICYAPMPLSVPNFIALDQTMYEKSATKNVLHPSVFWRARGLPGPKFTSPGIDIQQGPSINLPNFVPFWQPVYEIFAAKLRWFRWKRDRQKQ